MNKVLIECKGLIDKYRLDKGAILEQLNKINIEKDSDFVFVYEKDFTFTLIGETRVKDSTVVLTNIKKAIDYIEKDNSDIFRMLNH